MAGAGEHPSASSPPLSSPRSEGVRLQRRCSALSSGEPLSPGARSPEARRRQKDRAWKRLSWTVSTYIRLNRVVGRLRNSTRSPLRPAEREAIKRQYDCSPGLNDYHAIKTLLHKLGQHISDQELEELLALTGPSYVAGTLLSFHRLCRMMEVQKKKVMDDILPDTVEAFAALGGRKDRQGEVDTERLRREIERFGLTIDIDAMIREVDKDASGMIDFDEFSSMFDNTDAVGDEKRNFASEGRLRRSVPSFSLLASAEDSRPANKAARQRKRPRPQELGGGERASLQDDDDLSDDRPNSPLSPVSQLATRGVPSDPRELRRLLFDTQGVEDRLAAMRVDRDRDPRRAAAQREHQQPADRGWLEELSSPANKQRSSPPRVPHTAPRGNIAFLGQRRAPPAPSPHVALGSSAPVFASPCMPGRSRRRRRRREPGEGEPLGGSAADAGGRHPLPTPITTRCTAGRPRKIRPPPQLGALPAFGGCTMKAPRRCSRRDGAMTTPPFMPSRSSESAAAGLPASFAADFSASKLSQVAHSLRCSSPTAATAAAASVATAGWAGERMPLLNARRMQITARQALMGMHCRPRHSASAVESPPLLTEGADPFLAASVPTLSEPPGLPAVAPRQAQPDSDPEGPLGD